MTETAAQLLATFDSLPPQVQHELLAEIQVEVAVRQWLGLDGDH
jgi:hypothetical protein